MEIEILSAQFDLQEANRYSLWLTLGDSECAFAVLNDVTKTFIWVKRVKQTSFTKTIALFNELSAIPFAQVVVELDLQPSILVPSVLYQYSHKRDFLSFSAELSSEQDVMEHALPSLSLVNLFAIAPSIKTFIAPYFSKAKFVHNTSALLLAIQSLSRSVPEQPAMGALLSEANIYLCLFESGKLLFANNFSVKTKEDAAYWVLRLFDQFSLNITQVQLYLQGIEHLFDERALLLKQYISHVNLLPSPAVFTLAPELKSEQLHSFTDLFYLPLCEL